MSSSVATPGMRAWQVTKYGRPSEALQLTAVPHLSPVPSRSWFARRPRCATTTRWMAATAGTSPSTRRCPIPSAWSSSEKSSQPAQGPSRGSGAAVMGSGSGATGAHAELVVGPVDMAFDVPPELDDIEAAAFYYPFHLAHLGLHGRPGAGETVLVPRRQAGSGRLPCNSPWPRGQGHRHGRRGGEARGGPQPWR